MKTWVPIWFVLAVRSANSSILLPCGCPPSGIATASQEGQRANNTLAQFVLQGKDLALQLKDIGPTSIAGSTRTPFRPLSLEPLTPSAYVDSVPDSCQ